MKVLLLKRSNEKVEVKSIDQLLHPNFDESSLKEATVVSKMGLPASPGAATGQIVFTAEEAKAQSEQGKKVILMRPKHLLKILKV